MSVSSLQEFDSLSDRLRLHRQARKQAAIVVEGRKDRLFLDRIALQADVFEAGNRNAVLDVARSSSLSNIAYLVDRDFDDDVAQIRSIGIAVVAYDSGDLEAMLLLSSAFDNLIAEYGSEKRLAGLGGAASLRSEVLRQVIPIARLRRENAAKGWALRFDAVEPSARMRLTNPCFSIESYIDALLSKSDSTCSKGVLLAVANAEVTHTCPDSGLDLIRGRDALSVLGVYLRRAAGSLNQQESGVASLERALRLAANVDEIRCSAWYERLHSCLAS